jgi:hypothetical protein
LHSDACFVANAISVSGTRCFLALMPYVSEDSELETESLLCQTGKWASREHIIDIATEQTHIPALPVRPQPALGTKLCQSFKLVRFPLPWFEAPLCLPIGHNHARVQVNAYFDIPSYLCSDISPADLHRCDIRVSLAANVLGDHPLLWQRVQQQGDGPKRLELSIRENLKLSMAT